MSLPAAPPPGPFTVVLGVAQDGGLPHIGCDGARCREARRDPARRRRVVSLGLVTEGHLFLLDATPDLPLQVADLAGWRRGDAPARRPVDGIFLTHAHIGHYLGLAWIGREAAGARGVKLWGTARMRDFLRSNAPWDQLLRLGNADFRVLGDRAVRLPGGIRVDALPVHHREEYTDTVAFRIRGPKAAVLYLPDIDAWDEGGLDLVQVLAGVDRAYLDGTFWADGELEGRDMSEIPHPRVRETMERLSGLPPEERGKVRFIHLNHTNPLWESDSPERRRLREAGMDRAERGERFDL